MTYIIITLSFLISLVAFLFKPTKEQTGSNRRELTLTGWFILFVMVILLMINFWNEHVKKQADEAKALLIKEEKKNDLVQRKNDLLNWQLQKNNFQVIISKAKQDSINTSTTINNLELIKKLQTTAFDLSVNQNKLLQDKLTSQQDDINKQLYPLDDLSLDLAIYLEDTGIAKKYIERIRSLSLPNGRLLILPDSSNSEERDLYQFLNNLEISLNIRYGNFDHDFLQLYKDVKDRYGLINLGAYVSISNNVNPGEGIIEENRTDNNQKLKLYYDTSDKEIFVSAYHLKVGWIDHNKYEIKSFKDVLGKLVQINFSSTNTIDKPILVPETIVLTSKTGYSIIVSDLYGVMRLSPTQMIFPAKKNFESSNY